MIKMTEYNNDITASTNYTMLDKNKFNVIKNAITNDKNNVNTTNASAFEAICNSALGGVENYIKSNKEEAMNLYITIHEKINEMGNKTYTKKEKKVEKENEDKIKSLKKIQEAIKYVYDEKKIAEYQLKKDYDIYKLQKMRIEIDSGKKNMILTDDEINNNTDLNNKVNSKVYNASDLANAAYKANKILLDMKTDFNNVIQHYSDLDLDLYYKYIDEGSKIDNLKDPNNGVGKMIYNYLNTSLKSYSEYIKDNDNYKKIIENNKEQLSNLITKLEEKHNSTIDKDVILGKFDANVKDWNENNKNSKLDNILNLLKIENNNDNNMKKEKIKLIKSLTDTSEEKKSPHAFQEIISTEADGKLGPNTLSKLEEYLNDLPSDTVLEKTPLESIRIGKKITIPGIIITPPYNPESTISSINPLTITKSDGGTITFNTDTTKVNSTYITWRTNDNSKTYKATIDGNDNIIVEKTSDT